MINDNNEFLAYFSTFLLLTHLVSSLGILFRWNDLLTIIYKNKILILFLIPLAIVIRIYWYQIFFGITNELLWTDFLIHPTLNLTTFFSELLNQKITINSIGPDGPLFGTEKFQVLILAGCSGYEGIIIEISLLTFYIINIRDSLRLPNALLILHLAGMAMFCLNAMRIAVLILIGTVWSPEIALKGFHSVAGWISIVLVAIVAGYSLNRIPFFSRAIKSHISNNSQNILATDKIKSLLIPLVTLIATSILTQSISGEFAWLYPIPIIMTTISIYFFRLNYRFLSSNINVVAILGGIAAFIIWIIMIPSDSVISQNFKSILFSASTFVSVIWLIFRIFGAVIIVPIAEEIAFRGFLFPFLKNFFRKTGLRYYKTGLALLISSIGFGVLHSEILPAILAGVIYGLVQLRSGQLMDAIVAHATTNFLLAIYVLLFGFWSYW